MPVETASPELAGFLILTKIKLIYEQRVTGSKSYQTGGSAFLVQARGILRPKVVHTYVWRKPCQRSFKY